MLEKIFKLKQNKTTVTTELVAGLTTFMSMSYIIFINPAIIHITNTDCKNIKAENNANIALSNFFIFFLPF